MDILQLIEELEDVLDDASSVPFSKKVTVDPDEIYEIIKEIRDSLPEEIRQAKWVNDEKDRILAEANEQGQEILKQARREADDAEREAQHRVEELVNDHRIMKMATQQGEEIVAKAEHTARTVREGTFAYVDEILANTQENLRRVIQELENNRGELK
ncbi:MAG: ATPase [Ndongobacter sp.]|nr:ATPase [Ndongobacter sp.]